jgi:DNA-binding transcriptional MerR regulator
MAEVAEEKRLYKIGEVCRLADVQPYVLRYWETEFPALAPNKSGGGQRLYTQREIDVILRIKQLLYSEGFTIAGAKKKLEAELAAPAAAVPSASAEVAAPPVAAVPRSARNDVRRDRERQALLDVKRELSALLELLSE